MISVEKQMGSRARRRAASYLAIIAVVILVCAVPAAASAQINPFRNAHTQNLTEKDMQLMESAASKLRQSETVPIGQTEAWSNPESGSSGTVTLVQRFQRRDLPCQKVRHTIRDKAHATPSNFDIDLCRVATGEWKIGF